MAMKTIGWIVCLMAMGLSLQAFAVEEFDQTRGPEDAAYLEVRDEYTCLPDGATIHRHEHKVKVLSLYAVNRRLGETFIVTNPEYQTLEINRSETLAPDGRLVKMTPNARNEVLPGFCRMAAPYGHLRETVITHLGLERGAVIHLDYEIRSQGEGAPFLMGETLFSAPYPTASQSVVVRVPRGMTLHHALLNHPGLEPAVSVEGEFDRYEWILTDLPMRLGEAMAQDAADCAPLLVFSTGTDWAEIAGLLHRRLTRAANASSEIAAKVRELKKEAVDVLDLARAINRFVVEEVATAAIDPQYLSYQPLACNGVYSQSVGTALDKAVLMATMLREGRLFAEVVLVSRHRSVAKEVPSWLQFSEPRVLSTLREKLTDPLFLEGNLFMSPTRLVGGTLDENLAGRTVFRPALKHNHLQEIPLMEEAQNHVKAELNLTLDKEKGLTGQVALTVAGSLNPFISLSADWESWAKGKLKKLLPGAEVSNVRPVLMSETRSIFKGVIEKPVALEKEGDFMLYEIPNAPGGIVDLHIPFALSERTTPLWLPKILREEVHVHITLPEGLKVHALPGVRSIANCMGLFMVASKVEEDRITLVQIFNLAEQLIPAGEYPELRELLVEWQAAEGRRVVLE